MNYELGIMNERGLTLVELLVIIGIIIILAALAIPNYKFFQTESDLNNSAEEIVNLLRVAQNKTLASERESQWGVYFDNTTSPHQYILFKGVNFTSRDISFDEIHKLPSSVEIYQINLDSGKEVVFNRIIGETSQAGNLVIRLISDTSKSKTIYIENSGQVSFSSPITPSEVTRIKDSRHVHFNLGWSIQNATTLKFYFPAVPQTETISMANSFNIDKSEFDWLGSFSVGGKDQVFRIHTHSLDAFNTSLCVHRDRNQGKNNQEVIIYIVDGGIDKDIAHYLADTNDTVEKGFYANTMERQ